MKIVRLGAALAAAAGWTLTARAAEPPAADTDTFRHALKLLNQVPETQLSERADPGLAILKTFYDGDAPDFDHLRALLGRAEVRGPLNPSARVVLATLLASRWDNFDLAGNLWLSGLKSPNGALRERARQHVPEFIQPAHIPVLIAMLKPPETRETAQAVLQDVTGQTFGADPKPWRAWWQKEKGRADLVGHLLASTQDWVAKHPLAPFDQPRFWHVPEGVQDASLPFAQRSAEEKKAIAAWNDWIGAEVKRYVDGWKEAKPAIDRVIHQRDPRVLEFLHKLVADPGYGEYAAVILAWRGDRTGLAAVQAAYAGLPTAGRALAQGSLGDKAALDDLLALARQASAPMSFEIMDEAARAEVPVLQGVGVLSAEQAFEILAHQSFELVTTPTRKEKTEALQRAAAWLKENRGRLQLDAKRGYFVLPSKS